MRKPSANRDVIASQYRFRPLPQLLPNLPSSAAASGSDRTVPTSSAQPHRAPTEGAPSLDVLGLPVALTDYEGTLDLIDRLVERREQAYVCVCNVHTVMAASEDRELRSALDGAWLNVPDGQPLVWAVNALGQSLPGRVYGPELMWRACARAARSGQRFYLYGGRDQDALAQLADRLRASHPGLRIVGGYSPPYHPLSEEEREAISAEINDSGADVVWVGIGVPKQEKWMAAMRPHLQAPLLIGVGAAFDFHAGLVAQAPRWMQDRGLEWAYRLTQEPGRLWRRYLRYNPQFVVAFARQLARDRHTAASRRRTTASSRRTAAGSRRTTVSSRRTTASSRRTRARDRRTTARD